MNLVVLTLAVCAVSVVSSLPANNFGLRYRSEKFGVPRDFWPDSVAYRARGGLDFSTPEASKRVSSDEQSSAESSEAAKVPEIVAQDEAVATAVAAADETLNELSQPVNENRNDIAAQDQIPVAQPVLPEQPVSDIESPTQTDDKLIDQHQASSVPEISQDFTEVLKDTPQQNENEYAALDSAHAESAAAQDTDFPVAQSSFETEKDAQETVKVEDSPIPELAQLPGIAGTLNEAGADAVQPAADESAVTERDFLIKLQPEQTIQVGQPLPESLDLQPNQPQLIENDSEQSTLPSLPADESQSVTLENAADLPDTFSVAEQHISIRQDAAQDETATVLDAVTEETATEVATELLNDEASVVSRDAHLDSTAVLSDESQTESISDSTESNPEVQQRQEMLQYHKGTEENESTTVVALQDGENFGGSADSLAREQPLEDPTTTADNLIKSGDLSTVFAAADSTDTAATEAAFRSAVGETTLDSATDSAILADDNVTTEQP